MSDHGARLDLSAAVEVGARAYYEKHLMTLATLDWDKASEPYRRALVEQCRAVIEAAAPLIAAQALRDAATAIDEAQGPEGLYAEPAEVERGVISWLVDRADALEGDQDRTTADDRNGGEG